MKTILLFATALLLAPMTPALAGTPEDDYQAYLRYLRNGSANGSLSPGLEKDGAEFAKRVRDLRLEHPWTWWFYRVTIDPVANEVRIPLNGWIDYQNGGGTFILTSGAFSTADLTSLETPQDLLDAGFTTVSYDAELVDGNWVTIGSSSDASNGFAVNYTFTGFEPIIRARLRNGNGELLTLSDSNGFNVAETSILAVAVPEPASWAMLMTGFGLTGAALRRRRAGVPAPPSADHARGFNVEMPHCNAALVPTPGVAAIARQRNDRRGDRLAFRR